MTDDNLLLSEDGYPNAPDIKARLREHLTMSKFASSNDLYAEMNKQRCDARKHIEHLERELAEARKDAARYRWLRANSVAAADFTDIVALVTAADGLHFQSETDDLVDAAMKDKP